MYKKIVLPLLLATAFSIVRTEDPDRAAAPVTELRAEKDEFNNVLSDAQKLEKSKNLVNPAMQKEEEEEEEEEEKKDRILTISWLLFGTAWWMTR